MKVVEIPKNVNQEAVDACTEWLERTKTGEFTSVALAATAANGDIVTSVSETSDSPRLIGAVSVLQHRILVNRKNEVDTPS
jgi:hypothetical protein